MRIVQHIAGVLVAGVLLAGCPSPHVPPPKVHPPADAIEVPRPPRLDEKPPITEKTPELPAVDHEPDGQLSSVASDLEHEAEDDITVRQVVCYVYQTFYDSDTGQPSLPDVETFADQTATALAPRGSYLHYHGKASSLFGAFESLQAGDLDRLAAALACL